MSLFRREMGNPKGTNQCTVIPMHGSPIDSPARSGVGGSRQPTALAVRSLPSPDLFRILLLLFFSPLSLQVGKKESRRASLTRHTL